MIRLISKYNYNRRMYDLKDQEFTTMDKLQDIAMQGIEFKVVESETKKDITRDILLTLLEKDKDILTEDIIRKLIFCQNSRSKTRLSYMLNECISSFIHSYRIN